ncbi:MAG: tellurite resistance protein [Microbacteriaceae bacterium]|nr:tellurite resistance protein [Microbacteriaceae bacterium]
MDPKAAIDPKMPVTRIPFTTLAFGFGSAGLAGTWSLASEDLGAPIEIPIVLWLTAGVVWLAVIIAHVVRGLRSHERLIDQLRHPTQGPLAALVSAAGLLISAQVYSFAPALGKVLVIVFVILVAVFASWLLAHWGAGELRLESVHGGYYLPTVASMLIAGTASAKIGLTGLAIGAFSVGVFFWIVISVLLVARIAVHGAVPKPLVPTLAIFVAPPATAGTAWFAINGFTVDPAQYALLGLTVLMLMMQAGLVRRYRTLNFNLGFWSFTFPFAAVGSYGVEWLNALAVPGWQVWAWLLVAGVTVLIGSIAAWSIAGVLVRSRDVQPAR